MPHADNAARPDTRITTATNPGPRTSQSAAKPRSGSTRRAKPVGIIGEASTANPAATAAPTIATSTAGKSSVANRCRRLRPSACSLGWSTVHSAAWRDRACPVAKGGQEPVTVGSRERLDVVVGEAAGESNDSANLLENAGAPGAECQVGVDASPQVGRDRAVEVVGDHLHEDGTGEVVHRWRRRRSRAHITPAQRSPGGLPRRR